MIVIKSHPCKLLSAGASLDKSTPSHLSANHNMASNFNTYCFISEPDASLICSICMELASQPKQCEDCGNLFCRECIEKNGRNPCPTCRTVNPKYFKDVRSKKCFVLVFVQNEMSELPKISL